MQGCSVFKHEGSTPDVIVKPESQLPSFDSNMASRIDHAVLQLMQTNQIPGLAIGIVKNHQVVYSKGFGVASIETGRLVTPKTVFQLGSESKMMVGISVMQLQSQGKIDLDAPLANYLPYFHLPDPRHKKITIRQVLSHRSGLPYCLDYKQCDYLDYKSPVFDEEALTRHVSHADTAELVAEPGEKMQYSDFGFEMLGDLIARVSGQSFESYIKDNIFLPLGMTHSTFLLRDIPANTLAAPHVLNPDMKVSGYFPYSRQHAPSSHLFSNVEDMNRFALTQLNQGQLKKTQLLPVTAYASMWSPEIPTALPSPWEKTLGLGWFLGVCGDHKLVGHAGGDTGFAAEFIMAPDDDVAIVVMVNREYMVEDFSFQIMQWLLGVSPNAPPAAPRSETTH